MAAFISYFDISLEIPLMKRVQASGSKPKKGALVTAILLSITTSMVWLLMKLFELLFISSSSSC
jgi:hypothetical protein